MTVQTLIDRLQTFNLPNIPVVVNFGGTILRLEADDVAVRRGYVDHHGVPCPSFQHGARVDSVMEILIEVPVSWPDRP